MATIQVKDATGVVKTVNTINSNGQTTMLQSAPVVLSSDHSPISVSLSSGLGQKTKTNSQSIVLASDQGDLSVKLNSLIAGERPTKNVLATIGGGVNYQIVAASQTAQSIVGAGNGAAGDTLNRLVITVSTEATSTVMLTDGSGGVGLFTNYVVFPSNMGIGTYTIELGDLPSVGGPWKITTAAGVSVIAIGIFS